MNHQAAKDQPISDVIDRQGETARRPIRDANARHHVNVGSHVTISSTNHVTVTIDTIMEIDDQMIEVINLEMEIRGVNRIGDRLGINGEAMGVVGAHHHLRNDRPNNSGDMI